MVTPDNELEMNRVVSFADDCYFLSKFLCFELIAGHKITKACGKIRSGLRIKCRKGGTFFWIKMMNWYLLFNFLSSNIFGYCQLPNFSFKCFLKKFKWFIIVILMNILIKISGPFNFRCKSAGDMQDYAEILWWNVSSKLKTKFDFIEVFLFYSLSNFQKYAHNFEKFNWFQWSLTCYASNNYLRQKMT